MLALSRKKNEAIVINNTRDVAILEVKGDQVVRRDHHHHADGRQEDEERELEALDLAWIGDPVRVGRQAWLVR